MQAKRWGCKLYGTLAINYSSLFAHGFSDNALFSLIFTNFSIFNSEMKCQWWCGFVVVSVRIGQLTNRYDYRQTKNSMCRYSTVYADNRCLLCRKWDFNTSEKWFLRAQSQLKPALRISFESTSLIARQRICFITWSIARLHPRT